MTAASQAGGFVPLATLVPEMEFEALFPPPADNVFSEVFSRRTLNEPALPEKTESPLASPASLLDQEANQVEALRQRISVLETQLENSQAAFDAKLAELRHTLSENLADQLIGSIKSAEKKIAARLSEALSEILGPFVEEKIRLIAIDAFEKEAASLLSRSSIVKAEIRVPAMLHPILVEKFKFEGIEISPTIHQEPEIVIDVNGAVLSTRLKHWADINLNGVA